MYLTFQFVINFVVVVIIIGLVIVHTQKKVISRSEKNVYFLCYFNILYSQDTMNILKTEGFKFPEMKESDAMFCSDVAPDWADGEVCHRCRVPFSLLQRKVNISETIDI